MICNRCFDRQKYELRDIKEIYKRAEQNDNGLMTGTMLLIKARLSSQTLIIIREKIELSVLFHLVTIISNVKSYKNYES